MRLRDFRMQAIAPYRGVRIMKVLFCVVLILFANLSFASPDNPYSWNSIFIEAERGVSVKIVRNQESLRIEEFKLTIEGTNIEVAEKWFQDINQPQLRTLEITWGCGPLILNSENKVTELPSCSTFVSFDFYMIEDFEVFPVWYEDPKVTYVITEGTIEKRYIRRKISRTEWIQAWLDSTGKEWRTKDTRYEK